jgi:uncharacterized repeat protein (TIGR01451 family)
MATTRWNQLGTLLGVALGVAAALPAPARAQSVTAYTGQSCAGTRAGRNLSCTSNDFTTTATFSQPPPGLASCTAGSLLSLDVISTIESNSPTRYDGAVFLGERGNDPSRDDASQTCSVGVFPTSAPFLDLDGDLVGDFPGTSTAELAIRSVVAYCMPAAGTNVLGLPYTLVFDNRGAAGGTAGSVTAAANSKCVSTMASQVTGVIVQGWIRLTVETTPPGDPQPFGFTTSGTAAARPSSFSLAAGGTRTIEVPLDPTGGAQTVQLDEALVPGWVSTAAVSCTNPSGGAAPYVTVDGTTRRIAAVLDATNHGAVCTITNTKRAATLTKSFGPSSVGTGAPSTLSFTITNSEGAPAQGAFGFTDTFPAGLVVASPLAVSSTCGGALHRGGTAAPLAAGDAAVTFSGGSLASGTAACTVTVAVSSATVGSYTNGPAQLGGVTGVTSGVTEQTLTVYPVPNLLLVEATDAATARPADVVTYTLVVQNSGPGAATGVVVSNPLDAHLAWGADAFGVGVAFEFTEGAPASGLVPGTPVYSADGGATWTLVPTSGGGGVQAGFDGRVTNWRLPLAGIMPPGSEFTLTFKAAVK